MREAIKAFEKAVEQGDSQQTAEALSHAQKCLDKAVKHGIIKSNTASRRKARLARMVGTQSG